MNTPSPLIPQGTTPAKGKVSFFVKVLMILTIHVVVIGGMLLQGCKDTKDQSATPPPTDTTSADTNALPPLNNSISNNLASTNAPVGPAGVPQPLPGAPLQPVQSLAPAQPVGQLPPPGPVGAPTLQPMPQQTLTQPPATVTGDAKEYVIASGDTLGAVAKRNGVSLKAILEANPGINPKKLKVGQKVQIPAGTGAASSSSSAAGATGATADLGGSEGGSVYIVKTGDTLGKIARANHTTYKKIMALNNLKTTSIKIGEKLKMPAPKASAADTAPAATTAPMTSAPAPAGGSLVAPVSSPTLQPAPVAPAAPATGTAQ